MQRTGLTFLFSSNCCLEVTEVRRCSKRCRSDAITLPPPRRERLAYVGICADHGNGKLLLQELSIELSELRPATEEEVGGDDLRCGAAEASATVTFLSSGAECENPSKSQRLPATTACAMSTGNRYSPNLKSLFFFNQPLTGRDDPIVDSENRRGSAVTVFQVNRFVALKDKAQG